MNGSQSLAKALPFFDPEIRDIIVYFLVVYCDQYALKSTTDKVP